MESYSNGLSDIMQIVDQVAVFLPGELEKLAPLQLLNASSNLTCNMKNIDIIREFSERLELIQPIAALLTVADNSDLRQCESSWEGPLQNCSTYVFSQNDTHQCTNITETCSPYVPICLCALFKSILPFTELQEELSTPMMLNDNYLESPLKDMLGIDDISDSRLQTVTSHNLCRLGMTGMGSQGVHIETLAEYANALNKSWAFFSALPLVDEIATAYGEIFTNLEPMVR